MTHFRNNENTYHNCENDVNVVTMFHFVHCYQYRMSAINENKDISVYVTQVADDKLRYIVLAPIKMFDDCRKIQNFDFAKQENDTSKREKP